MAHAEKAESLTAKSQSDTAVPEEAMDKSRAEQIEATNLKAEAAELKTESDGEHGSSIGNISVDNHTAQHQSPETLDF